MTAQNSTAGKVVGNIGLLDLREATEESVAGIEKVGNVGLILYTAQTAPLVTRLSIGNLGNSIEVPVDTKLIEGQFIIRPGTLPTQPQPVPWLITGQLIIQPDVTVEELTNGLGELIVAGHVLCPANLSSTINGKIREMRGNMQVYNAGAKLINGRLTLTESYLQLLPDNSELVVLGRLTALELLPNDLLMQKIKLIQIEGRVTCREENASTLLARLDVNAGLPQMEVIPTGFVPVERALTLSADLLTALPGKKLYLTDVIRIEADVTADALDQALEALISNNLLIAPSALKSIVAKKCNLLETTSVFYNGELWYIEGEMTLLPGRFIYLADKATLVVRGELRIDPAVEAQTLADKLDKVHLLGEILATSDQIAALQSRLGTYKGEFVDTTKEELPVDHAIGNIGVLKL